LQKQKTLLWSFFAEKKQSWSRNLQKAKNLVWMFAKNRKLGLKTCFHDLMMEVEKPWGVCWGCSAQLLQCGGISLSLSPIELVCDTESDHMTNVVAVFHTDCCCSSSSFADFNP
jgi:hypothetical protein